MIAELMSLRQIFEAGMLLCWGISWPIDIFKSLRSRRTEGKSVAFMAVVLVGYCFGLTAKFVKAAQPQGVLEPVTALYAFNWLCVAVDIVLYRRFSKARV